MSTPQERKTAKQIEDAIASDDWSKARLLIRRWLRRDPENHWLLTRLALTYYEQRQYQRALRYSVQALQSAPYCQLAIWDYAGALNMMGQHKEALALYRWLISWGEDELAYGPCGEGIRSARSLIADCYYCIGKILEGQHQWKRAAAAFEQHLSKRTPGTRSIYRLREARNRYQALVSR